MNLKRITAFLLVLCMTLSFLPAGAQAAEDVQSTLEGSNMSVTGTNSFGTLLSNEILASQEETESDYQAGYSVTDLTISGSTATAVYDALEEATLVVAVYTEDGLQLLASGKATVSPEETEATVTIEGTMPEYFYATAFLMDTYDYAPLCEAYSTPMYTREMQELLASTVEDYDAERVYNLDDDSRTNFAVFAEGTIVIREQDGVNTIVSADDDARIYVIENADAVITSLTQGDVLAYPHGEGEILIVKVASITVDGTTATITGSDLEMEEVFEAVKIEVVTSELSVDPNYQADGITRLDSPAQSRSWDTGIEIGESFTYAFDVYGRDISSGGAVKLTGSLTIGITAAVTVYSTKSYTRVETKLDFSQHYIVTAEGKGAFEADTPFEVFTLSPFVGVTVTVKPKLILEFSCAITIDYAYTASMGSYINYDGNTWSAHTIRENPKPELDFKFEGTIFLGISLTPTVELLKGKLAKVALEAKLGVELKGTQSLVDWENDPSCLHECDVCVDFDLSIVCSMEPSITLVNNPNLSLKAKLVDIKFKFLDAYWCKDRDEFHLGTCPYLSYRVTMGVLDENNRPLPNMAIRLSDGSVHNTGNAGAVAVYLPNGTYTASLLSNDFTASTRFTVADDSRSVLLSADEAEPDFGLPGDVSSESVTDYGALRGSGTCGSNLSWRLTEGGTLIITGTGKMNGWYMPDIYSDGSPWYYYRYYITAVEIQEGVTSIGSYAFYDLGKLTRVSIPETVTAIGSNAFAGCSSLTDISIPSGVTRINGHAFEGCSSLRSMDIPVGVTEISYYAFFDCSSLTSVTIPDGVTEIGTWAFAGCSSLASISIPASVTHISDAAFSSCRALKEIIFLGDAPATTLIRPFDGISATAYYPANNSTWTDEVMQTYGGKLTWVAYTPDSDVALSEAIPASYTGDLVIGEGPTDEMTPDAILGGDYTTEIVDNSYILKTATFSGLVPGADYVMLALKNLETGDVLAADNLLGILQGTAGDDGTLKFQYVQRVNTEVSYVVACGASNKNLKDATITFPEMTADGNVQAVNPTVVYGGVTLTEGVDYEISGTVDFTEAGEYTCQIRGFHNYTGTVICTYTVTEVTVVQGDVNDDGEIDILDANLVVTYYNEIINLTGDQLLAADVNGDGEVDIMDANMIVAYYNEVIDFFPAK